MARQARLRHLRHGKFSRVRRRDNLRVWLDEQATDLAGTGTAHTVTLGGAAFDTFTKVAHGLAVGAGPFILTAATTLPGGYLAGTLVWVQAVLSADTFTVATTRGARTPKTHTNAGTGALTLTKASTAPAIHSILKSKDPAVVGAATDVDNL